MQMLWSVNSVACRGFICFDSAHPCAPHDHVTVFLKLCPVEVQAQVGRRYSLQYFVITKKGGGGWEAASVGDLCSSYSCNS